MILATMGSKTDSMKIKISELNSPGLPVSPSFFNPSVDDFNQLRIRN